jgi:hypothetical protein
LPASTGREALAWTRHAFKSSLHIGLVIQSVILYQGTQQVGLAVTLFTHSGVLVLNLGYPDILRDIPQSLQANVAVIAQSV